MNSKGFFSVLFDLSFSEFITFRVIKVLYIIGIVIAGLAALFMIIGAFTNGVVAGIVCLILSPLVFLLYVLMIRVWLEIVLVLFKIADNTSIMAGVKSDDSGIAE
ncbi:DUF4282 domain-containing protein [bacterium]|nr:DUF4282 domain-containing protein [bacterium]